MLSMFSSKVPQYIFGAVLAFAISACSASPSPLASPTSTTTATITAQSSPAPTPTEDLAAQKQKISDEASRKVEEFNQLVEQEKLLGNIETSHNSGTGQDFFTFTGESDTKIRAAHKNLVSQLEILRDQYLGLYKQDYNPTPFPTFSTKEEALKFYYQAMQEDQDWLEAQEKSESAFRVYDPDRGNYLSVLTFEQSAWLGLRIDALNNLRMEAELPPELLAKHKAVVEKLDGMPVEVIEITSLPYYRNDITLFQYQTQKNYYFLNADGTVVEITPVQQDAPIELEPVQSPVTAESAFNSPLGAKQLEEKAHAFIDLIAPGTNLDALTLTVSAKTSNFFFKWEDRTKPPLDGGGFPFIQVALNLNGDLLNYINTLPLSR